MTDPIRAAAQALDKLQTSVEAYANTPSLALLGEMRETFAALRAALSVPQPAADERVAEHMQTVRHVTEAGDMDDLHIALTAVESSARALLAAGREDATLTDEQIIAVRKRVSPIAYAPWSDTLAFARAIIKALQKGTP